MPRQITYRLSDSRYTIYHRAALGGLAATIRSWNRVGGAPDGIGTEVDKDQVTLAWDDASDRSALQRLLAASFRVTPDLLVDLPGQGIQSDALRLAVHGGLCGTFLQHPKMRPGPSGTKQLMIAVNEDDPPLPFTYKPVSSYAHQKAQGTGLLDTEKLPDVATVPQSVVPGALTGATQLEARGEDALLLLYLLVGAAVFQLRPGKKDERVQYCVVVPDPADLVKFARVLPGIASNARLLTSNLLGRHAGGSEDATLRFDEDQRAVSSVLDAEGEIAAINFYADRELHAVTESEAISGYVAVTMGKVAWDRNQVNRSATLRIAARDRKERRLFLAAARSFHPRLLSSKDGTAFVAPALPIPELIAANLARGLHWAQEFAQLVSDKNDFNSVLRFGKEGLVLMSQNIEDSVDNVIIEAFHEAWRRAQAQLGERARSKGEDFGRLVEVERERMRNQILREKSAAGLSGWFLRFCADASRGASLGPFQSHRRELQSFIFADRNFERFRNLCLFALVSYSSRDSKGDA